MLWTEEKLRLRIEELSELRYRESIPISGFLARQDTTSAIASLPPGDGVWSEVSIGHRWEGRDHYLWLSADVDVPADWKDRRVVGRFNFGRTGSGTNSGFESLLYVNGMVYQGVDSNHQEVFFAPEAAGARLALQFRLWSGLEGGGPPRNQEHRLERAEIAWLDETADDLYFTAKAVLETVLQLHDDSPERALLLRAVDGAFRLIDWSYPASQPFYDSVERASKRLHAELGKLEKQHPVTVTCIGHTHIDVAWLWRLKHTREKAARSFSTVLRLMELYPDYIFLQTQPQLYKYIKHDYPELYEQIRERVKEGRWEAGGAMWLEADCNVTSGESLVRQILLGTRFLQQEFGVECKYLWLPDVFGYSWALPQILRKSGINTFMTTKISWSEYNRFPHDTFRWRGIDGSEVLTHFITTPDLDGAWFYTYNGEVRPRTVKGIWDNYRDKTVNQELLLSYGYGDGGGGVNREMLEMRRRVNELPGLPHVVTGRADEYFERLHHTVDETEEYVHTWNGELYLEYHRGTYTTQAYNKRMNRKLELLYREAEWLSALQCVLLGDWGPYRQEKLNEGWEIILRNQFHDIIPGSSIREVYEDSVVEYGEAVRIGEQVKEAAVHAVAAGQERELYTLFNSASWSRAELVTVPVSQGFAEGRWVDGSGRELKSQLGQDGWIVQSPEVSPMGWAQMEFVRTEAEGERFETPFRFVKNGVTTPYYEMEWNEQGQLTKLYDLLYARNVIASGEKANVLQLFEDKPRRHNAWDIDIYYNEKMKEVSDLRFLKVVENGPLRAVIRMEWRFGTSVLTQNMIVYTSSRRIDFETTVEWRERQTLLKAAFPVHILATEATYDIQFGNVKRPTHWNTSWDYARFETVGHQWADLSERGYGVSLMNDCKYGYDIKDSVMRLTLLRSTIHPDTEADQGTHRFTYSLLPHSRDWLEGGTVQEAWQINQPLTAVHGAVSASEAPLSMFKLSASHVMIDAVKKTEDGDEILLRCHEFAGARTELEISSDFEIVSWRECNLLEAPLEEERGEDIIRLSMAPYEIKTLRVKLKAADTTL